MDQNQSSWQPIARVLDQKLTGEDAPVETSAPAPSVAPSVSLPESSTLSALNPALVSLSPPNLALLEKLVTHLTETSASLVEFVRQLKGESPAAAIPSFSGDTSNTMPLAHPSPRAPAPSFAAPQENHNAARVLEGVFDGTRMMGADGEFYPVPPNYASKSKLVEGDLLKLTVTSTGAFIYKQIGPINRKRLIGELLKRQDGDTILFDVFAQGKVYHVLSAAITYYKGEQGDEVAICVPENSPSQWAAVEYVVKKSYAPHF
ncbi:MAG: hypothetical protein HY981_04250 [Candidatus Magasanikbacteria bacterium]|nr:hypothetical protein [Candidatus Magasanikbacteria bacterium]